MSISLILLIVAFIFFVLAAIPKTSSFFGFLPAGLALWVLAVIIEGGGLTGLG